MRQNDVFIVIVRHTPAFAFVHRFAIGTATGSSFSPLREGMGYRITLIINRAPPAIPSRRGVPRSGGVCSTVKQANDQLSHCTFLVKHIKFHTSL